MPANNLNGRSESGIAWLLVFMGIGGILAIFYFVAYAFASSFSDGPEAIWIFTTMAWFLVQGIVTWKIDTNLLHSFTGRSNLTIARFGLLLNGLGLSAALFVFLIGAVNLADSILP